MATIDFHNHFYPPAYLEALERGPSAVHISHDAAGNPRVHYPGDYNIVVRGQRDIDYREEVLREAGVDTQVITLTTPGTHVEEPATGARLASLVNDAFAGIVAGKGGRFAALATLPLNDPAASLAEFRRAMEQLHLPGQCSSLDRGYAAFEECRQNISQAPSVYLKRSFYYDTVNFDSHAIEFAISFAGADHLVAGSDYPHQIGSISKMLSSLQALSISEDDRLKILGGNAARLLGCSAPDRKKQLTSCARRPDGAPKSDGG